MSNQPRLTDGNILLRRYRDADAEPVYWALQESIDEISPWMPWCHEGYSLQESIEWVNTRDEAWRNGIDFDFVITDVKDGSILGGCGLNHIEDNDRLANLGYWVRTSKTGRGIASAATRLLARFALKELKLNRLEIVVAVDNIASQRAAARSGAKREGILRKRTVVRDRIHDAVMFSLVAEDLQ